MLHFSLRNRQVQIEKLYFPQRKNLIQIIQWITVYYYYTTLYLLLQPILQQVSEVWGKLDRDIQEDYGKEYVDTWVHSIQEKCSTSPPISMQPVIEALTDAVLSPSPSTRYLIGGSTGWIDKSKVRQYVFLVICRTRKHIGTVTIVHSLSLYSFPFQLSFSAHFSCCSSFSLSFSPFSFPLLPNIPISPLFHGIGIHPFSYAIPSPLSALRPFHVDICHATTSK